MSTTTQKSKASFAKSTPDIAVKPSPRTPYKEESSRGFADDNSSEIEERVQVAAKKFEVLQGNIQHLIECLKAQHLSIKTLDEDRLKTAKQLEVLIAESPLAAVIASSNLIKQESVNSGDSVRSDSSDELTWNTQKSIAAVKKTYLELHKNQYDLVLEHAKSFDSSIVQYAEEWLEVISVRISSNMMEFKKLSESLEHYTKKVDKLKAKQKPDVGKASPKRERNEIKLLGARESHDNMGENLYKLMEEFTVRAWKDLLPLLMQSIQLDLKQAAGERDVIWDDLKTVLEALEAMSAQYDVTTTGRLARLKKEHIDTLYSGTHSSHRTPIKASTTPKPTSIKTPVVIEEYTASPEVTEECYQTTSGSTGATDEGV